ncbi:hypothetical protein POM88_053650 [Heracleum sosnowskyi]|uniref:Replication factor A C-terminal domain-containing protein n=1 Tax=Heracleum sosnowskyi TaxID=360622 RepID=A0AAD8GP99_9APIA|nr:hypothetical protein POM88_053650 [Heracleum sosnowskyi]
MKYTGQFRIKKHLYFTPHTKIEKDETIGLEIEEYAFDLYYMEEIEKIADENRFLIDMVGKVENVQEIIKTKKNNHETSRLKFEISDGRFRVKVTLFEEFGNMVEEKFKKLDENEIYVIICCARVGRYEGKRYFLSQYNVNSILLSKENVHIGTPNLTNYPATRIHINPNHYSINELKKNLAKKRKLQHDSPQDDVVIPKLTVKQIRQIKPDFNKKEVICEVSVKKLEEKSSWYYTKCTDCDIEIFRENGIFKCSKCNRIFPYPDKRFRVCTLCSDNTGSIAIIFPASEVSRITDTAVVDIHSECLTEKDEDKFPDVLKIFLNQKYTITLEIKEENIKKGSTVFEAKEIVATMDICDSFDPNTNQRVETNEASAIKDMDEEEANNQTPQTGNSTNMKSRARKNVEPVEYDVNGNNHFKNIKK